VAPRSWMCRVVTSLLAGCGSVPDVERDPVPLTQTAELRYPIERHDFAYMARIPYEFRNHTGGDVRLADCREDVRPLLQVRRNGAWVDAWHPPPTSCDGPPLVVAPGGTFTDTLSVVGGPSGSNVTPTFIFEDVEGVYRLYWYQASLSDTLPEGASASGEAWRVSNPFVLVFD
jgi:hypothetical protein